MTLTIKNVKDKIKQIHGNEVTLDESTYKNASTKARFIDKDYGEWWAIPKSIFCHHCGHPKRGLEKQKQTNLKRYGVECSLRNKEVQEKTKHTNLERYGTENPFENKEIQEKIKQTMLKRYGVEHPVQCEKIQEKIKQTMLERYGVESPLQNKEIQEKIKQTMLKRYGVEHPSQCEEIKKKQEKTNLERYGAKCSMQNHKVALKNAKAQNNICIFEHWFSREDVICSAGYEIATVEYFNKNKIDYNWQVQTFLMPDGRTFRPDCYLPDEDKWIEIKGYFRNDAQEKWEWFHKKYPNSELWDKDKLKEMNIL